MARDTIIDEDLAREQKQKWGLRRRRHDEQEPADEPAAPEDEVEEDMPREIQEPPAPKEPSKFKEFVGGMLSGSILSKAEVRRQYPYMLFLAVLMMLYIGNTFRMQHLYRRQQALTAEVKELRSKSVTLSANLAEMTRRSAIIEELERRGIELEESIVPPTVIQK